MLYTKLIIQERRRSKVSHASQVTQIYTLVWVPLACPGIFTSGYHFIVNQYCTCFCCSLCLQRSCNWTITRTSLENRHVALGRKQVFIYCNSLKHRTKVCYTKKRLWITKYTNIKSDWISSIYYMCILNYVDICNVHVHWLTGLKEIWKSDHRWIVFSFLFQSYPTLLSQSEGSYPLPWAYILNWNYINLHILYFYARRWNTKELMKCHCDIDNITTDYLYIYIRMEPKNIKTIFDSHKPLGYRPWHHIHFPLHTLANWWHWNGLLVNYWTT